MQLIARKESWLLFFGANTRACGKVLLVLLLRWQSRPKLFMRRAARPPVQFE